MSSGDWAVRLAVIKLYGDQLQEKDPKKPALSDAIAGLQKKNPH